MVALVVGFSLRELIPFIYYIIKLCKGGMRWHQGRITSINKENSGGTTTYNGVHTKGQSDGKSSTYSGHNYEFQQYPLHKLRVGPNVFDLLYDEEDSEDEEREECDENEEGADIDDIDVYFSYYDNDGSGDGFKDSLDPASVAEELKTKGNVNTMNDYTRFKIQLSCSKHVFAHNCLFT